MTVGAAAGSQITTIEGLAAGGRLHALQAAFLETGAFQCGYCTPGMILSAASLLAANPQPTDAEITRRHAGQHLPLRLISAHRSPRSGLAASTAASDGAPDSEATGGSHYRAAAATGMPAPRRSRR